MKIVQTIGDVALASLIVIVLAGTVAGTLKGKAFDGVTAWQFVLGGFNRIAHGTDLATGRATPTNETPRQLVENNLKAVIKDLPSPSPIQQQPALVPAPSNNRPATGQQPSIDLSKCLPGTVNQSNTLTANQLKALKTTTFKTLWEVQAKAGNPLCAIASNTWLYRSPGGVLTVTESKSGVTIR